MMKRIPYLLIPIFLIPLFSLAQQNVGIGTTLPGSKLTINGSFAAKYDTINGPYQPNRILDSTNFFISWLSTADDTLLLPPLKNVASNLNYKGRIYHVKNNTNRYLLTIMANGSERISNISGSVSNVVVPYGESISLISTGNTAPAGVSWEVMQQNIIASPTATFWKVNGNDGTNPASYFLGTQNDVGMAIRTNNIERMRITNTGNIGIATTTPLHRLQIVESSTLDTTIFSLLQPGLTGGAGSRRTFMKIGRSLDNNNAAHWGFHYTALNSIQNYMGFGFRTGGIDSNRLVIRADGNVGIGTSSPGSKLMVNGSFGASYDSTSLTTFNMDSTNFYLVWNGATSNGTVNLPQLRTTASNLNYKGRLYCIKNNSVGNILTIEGFNTERIDVHGGGTGVPNTLLYPGEIITLISTGGISASGITWEVINHSIATSPTSSFWRLTGNTGTVAASNFLGTRDNNSLIIGAGTGNNRWMHLTPQGLLRLARNAHDTSGATILTNKIRSRLFVQKDAMENDMADDYIFESYGNSYDPNLPQPGGTTTQNLVLRRAAGTMATPLELNSGELIGQIVFDPYLTSIGYTGTGSKITSDYIERGITNNNAPRTTLKFYTSSGDMFPLAVRGPQMTITEDGNVGIGAAGAQSRLRVNGSISLPYHSFNIPAINLTDTNYCVTVNGTATNQPIINLPEVGTGFSLGDSRIYVIRNNDPRPGHIALIRPFPGETISGLLEFRLPFQYAVTIMKNSSSSYDNGTEWNVLHVSRFTFEEIPAAGEGGTVRLDDAEDNDAWHIDQFSGDGNPRMRFIHDNSVTGGEKLCVLENGRVGIGTSTPNALLTVNGSASKPGGGDWLTISDLRAKKNIQPYIAGLKEILAINPVIFQYNDKVYKEDGKRHIGIIAQEIEKVLPGTVTQIEAAGIKDLRQFDGSEITYTLINAVKEQQSKIEILKAKAGKAEYLQQEIQTLKADNENLRKQLLSYAELASQVEELKKNQKK